MFSAVYRTREARVSIWGAETPVKVFPSNRTWTLSRNYGMWKIRPFSIEGTEMSSEFVFSQAAAYLTRPQPWIRESIRYYKSILGIGEGVVGVHVRRTDKISTNESKFIPFSNFTQKIDERFGKRAKLFLVTDDGELWKKELVRHKGLHEIVSLEHYMPAGPRTEGFRWFILSIYLLAECEGFVGTFSSNIGRLVYELRYARRGRASIENDTLSMDEEYKMY